MASSLRITRRRFAVAPALVGYGIWLGQPLVGQDPATPTADDLATPVVSEPDGAFMFKGNAARTGEMPGPGPDPANGIDILWQFETLGPVDSSPAVVDGMIFVGSKDTHVYALDAMTGTETWRFKSGGEVNSSPAVVNGVVYVGSSDSTIYALNADTAGEVWRFTSDAEVESSPVVVDGMVYFGNGNGVVHALDTSNGAERWRFAASEGVVASPSYADGRLYIASIDSNVHALDAATGTEKWRFDAGDGVWSSPSIAGGMIYFGNNAGYVYALDSSTGVEIWRFDTGAPVSSSPAISNGMVIVGSSNASIYGLEAASGLVRWQVETDGGVWSSPATVDGIAYVTSDDGNVYALDILTGREIWRIAIGIGSGMSSPAVVNNLVIAGSWETHRLYAIGARPLTLEPGALAKTRRTTDLLGAPAATAVVREVLAEGSEVSITGDSESSGDTIWWPVSASDSGAVGWVIASDLEPIGNASQPASPPEPLSIEAQDPFDWSTNELSGAPGQVILATNVGFLEHDFVVDELGIATDLPPGETIEITIPDDARVGESYVYYCSVAGHREGGMAGTLTISEPSQALASPNDGPLSTEQLMALLPTPEHVPNTLTSVTDVSRTREEVIEALGGARVAEANLEDWGWSGNAERQFSVADPETADATGATFLSVSVHGFKNPESAAKALPFFSDILVTSGGYADVEVAGLSELGETTRLLSMTDTGGQSNVALYIQDGSVTYRLGGFSPSGDATEDILAVATAMNLRSSGDD